MKSPSPWGVSPAGITTATLLVCAVGVGFVHVRGLIAPDPLAFVFIAGVAASASVLMMMLSAAISGLFGDGPPAFPRTVTLPVVFQALLLLCATLWTTPGNALVLPHDALSVVLLWSNPGVLVVLALIQVAALSLLGGIWRRVAARARR